MRQSAVRQAGLIAVIAGLCLGAIAEAATSRATASVRVIFPPRMDDAAAAAQPEADLPAPITAGLRYSSTTVQDGDQIVVVHTAAPEL